MRCIISLVFLVKLGKIVIVKEENSPLKRRVFDLKIAYFNASSMILPVLPFGNEIFNKFTKVGAISIMGV